MAIVGDVTVSEMKPLIEKYFGGWQKADVPVTKYTDPQAPDGTVVNFAAKDAAVQSVVDVTYPLDLMPGDKDVLPAKVATNVLGGGSQGRLFLDLREKHAWTYGSYATLNEDELVGHFTANAKCRNAVTDSAVGEILHEMKRMQTEPVDDQALQNTISYMSGNFAISLEDPGRVAQFAINIERYHMPKDYYANYLKNLAAVTAGDVQKISTKYITPEHANIAVVGSKDQAEKLAKYAKNGKVNYFDNYGRPVKPQQTMPVPAGVTIESIMKKYVNAIGGEKALEGIKDIKETGEAEVQPGRSITIVTLKKTGGYMKRSIMMGTQTFQKQVLADGKGTEEAMGQKKSLEGQDLNDLMNEADIQAVLHTSKHGISRILKGSEQVSGATAYVVEVNDGKGNNATEYYDATSGYLIKEVKQEDGPQGKTSVATEYADYKEVPGANGYKAPYTVRQQVGPQMLNMKVKSVEVNKGIAVTEFQ